MLKNLKNLNALGSVIIIVCCVWLFLISLKFPARDSFWPQGIIVFLIILCSLNMFSSQPVQRAAQRVRVVLYIALTLIYIFVSEYLGYFISTTLFILLSLVFLNERKWFKIVLIPIVTSVVIYFVFFRFLGVPLPRGILF